jgi:O-methyltransferase involved in polyketide biosynthesis
MARTDDDTWDLASSVGATATMVAAARAVATGSDKPLINDPFALPLVEAVGIEMFTWMARGEMNLAELDDERLRGVERMRDNMAARTKFFDDFFLDATAAGIRQVVILASGLDARAYRLPWPAGTVVYEIDQPTAWIAEGLLGYLPPDAQDGLLDSITALSIQGSWFATECIAGRKDIDEEAVREHMKTVSAQWRQYGFDLDLTELVYFGERNEAAEYLTSHGWETNGRTTRELFGEYGLEPIEADQPFADVVYVRGILK